MNETLMQFLRSFACMAYFCFIGTIHAQSFGGSVGLVGTKLMEPGKGSGPYRSMYGVKSGYSARIYGETTVDPTNKFRTELAYNSLSLDMDIDARGGHSSFHRNVVYSVKRIGVDLIYAFDLCRRPGVELGLLVGPTISYGVSEIANGDGSGYRMQSLTDANGDPINVPVYEYWEWDNQRTDEINSLAVGLGVGLEVRIPITEAAKLIFQNRYYIYPTNTTRSEVLRYTMLFNGEIAMGIQYHMSK